MAFCAWQREVIADSHDAVITFCKFLIIQPLVPERVVSARVRLKSTDLLNRQRPACYFRSLTLATDHLSRQLIDLQGFVADRGNRHTGSST